jgi:hypothetical protein
MRIWEKLIMRKILTGFKLLDDQISGGIRPGIINIIGGYTKGKTKRNLCKTVTNVDSIDQETVGNHQVHVGDTHQ